MPLLIAPIGAVIGMERTLLPPIAEREFTFVNAKTGDVSGADLEVFGFGQDDWHTVVFVNDSRHRFDAISIPTMFDSIASM